MSEFFGQEIQVITVSVPVGTMIEYAGDTAPNDWMICDGRALDKSAYALLFAVLGEKFGSGDGSGAQFNIPDCRDRVTVGKSGTKAVGATGGAETFSYDYSHSHGPGSYVGADHLHSMQNHYHGVGASDLATIGVAAGGQGPVSLYGHGHGGTGGPSTSHTAGADRGLGVTGQSSAAAITGSHSNMQPYVVTNKLIKVV